MHYILEILSSFTTGFVEDLGYFAVFILMFLESALVPIPSEITMPFAGFMSSQGKLNFWLVSLVGALANLGGSLLAYYVGFFAGKTLVHRWVKKYGRYILISIDEIEQAEKWFRSHGELITFVSRLMPVVRTFISLPAGMSRMDVKKFSLYTFAGAAIWSTALTYIGFVLGKNWQMLEPIFKKFQYVIIIILIGLIAFYIYHKLQKINAQKHR